MGRFGRLGAAAVTAAALLASAWLPGAASPAPPRPLKIATWNLEWLTLRRDGDPSLPDDAHAKRPEDIATLARYAAHLDADLVGMEEVDGPEIAARVFPPERYHVEITHDHVVQRVGLAVRRDLQVTRHDDLTALDTNGAAAAHPLRSGLDVTISDGPDSLRMLVVHLKTGCWDNKLTHVTNPSCRTLIRQLGVLQAWLRARRAEAMPFAVMGDFNRDMLAQDEFLQALQAAAPMRLVTAGHANPCWGGEAFIDHILLGGGAESWLMPDSLRVMTYRETDPAMKDRLSDHCAVSVRVEPK